MNKSELYNKINNQILDKLNEGIIPWKKSWKVGLPANFISKRNYRGVNFLSLSLKDFASPYYLTFYQCKQKGGSVIAGEKSTMVIYYKLFEVENSETDNKIVPFVRYSNVFNITQTDLVAADTKRPILKSCKSIIDQMKEKPTIKHNISRCYYTPKKDYISLPQITDFNSQEEYYSTLFHELIHWTGHISRLNRRSLEKYGDGNYDFEELIAEIGSSYLSALCGIFPKVVDNQASYIDGYLNLSKEKELVFPQAAKIAQQAVAYILSK